MTTTHLVDPEIVAMLDLFPPLQFTPATLPQVRRTVSAADPHPYTGEFIWTPDANRFGWASLLGEEPGGADVSPYAAAARAARLAGLPPTYIGVGALDLFVEEDLEYARRLIREGVPTELHVYPGAFHAFDLMAESQVARAHTRDSLDALRRALYPLRDAALPTADPAYAEALAVSVDAQA